MNKIMIPREIADILDQKGCYQQNKDLYSPIGSVRINLNSEKFKNFVEYYDEERKFSKKLFDWYDGHPDRHDTILAYMNPLTSPNNNPDLWFIK